MFTNISIYKDGKDEYGHLYFDERCTLHYIGFKSLKLAQIFCNIHGIMQCEDNTIIAFIHNNSSKLKMRMIEFNKMQASGIDDFTKRKIESVIQKEILRCITYIFLELLTENADINMFNLLVRLLINVASFNSLLDYKNTTLKKLFINQLMSEAMISKIFNRFTNLRSFGYFGYYKNPDLETLKNKPVLLDRLMCGDSFKYYNPEDNIYPKLRHSIERRFQAIQF